VVFHPRSTKRAERPAIKGPVAPGMDRPRAPYRVILLGGFGGNARFASHGQSKPGHLHTTWPTQGNITMRLSFLRVAVLVAASGLILPATFAAAGDYRFDLLDARPAASGTTDVTVRLAHLPDRKPVSDAIIFQPTAVMAGMENAPAAATVEAGTQPGTYVLHVATGMGGPWTLNLTAKVQGEAETIRSAVPFEAAK
jgi:hypothetical protein